MLKASCRFFFSAISTKCPPLSTPGGGVGFPLLNNTAVHFCCLHTITHTHNNVTHFHALCLIGAFREEARFKYARASFLSELSSCCLLLLLFWLHSLPRSALFFRSPVCTRPSGQRSTLTSIRIHPDAVAAVQNTIHKQQTVPLVVHFHALFAARPSALLSHTVKFLTDCKYSTFVQSASISVEAT